MKGFILRVTTYGPARELEGLIRRSSITIEDVYAGRDLASFIRDPLDDSSTEVIDRVIDAFQVAKRCSVNYEVDGRTMVFDVFEPDWEETYPAFDAARQLIVKVISACMVS